MYVYIYIYIYIPLLLSNNNNNIIIIIIIDIIINIIITFTGSPGAARLPARILLASLSHWGGGGWGADSIAYDALGMLCYRSSMPYDVIHHIMWCCVMLYDHRDF